MTNSKKIRLLRLGQSVGVLIGLLVLAVILSILTPLFLTIDNLLNVALQSATYILVATGMTFVVVTGGIDLSVGSIAALAGVVMALAMKAGVNPGISVFLGLIVGIVCGLLNGLLVAKANLPPFIVTLATMSVIRGLALILTGGILRPQLELLPLCVSLAWDRQSGSNSSCGLNITVDCGTWRPDFQKDQDRALRHGDR